MIAFGWLLVDPDRSAGRLPKYNPARQKTFSLEDWTHVCRQIAGKLHANGAEQLAEWAQTAACKSKPVKSDQDQLDACICLSVAIHLAKSRDALLVGNCSSGYILVPDSQALRDELASRCDEIGHVATEFIHQFRFEEAINALCGGLAD
jgi:predicted RNase H-like nuclease